MADRRADRMGHGIGRAAAALFSAALVAAALTACQMRPLYAPEAAGGTGAYAELSRIDVAPIDGRAAQSLRNELLFMLSGGQPTGADYVLALHVEQREREAMVRHIDGEPHSRILQLRASYRLIRSADDAPLADGRVTRMATYEVSRQRFANDRASLDAANRAAREAAEAIRMRLATFFASGGASHPHASPPLDLGEDILGTDVWDRDIE